MIYTSVSSSLSVHISMPVCTLVIVHLFWLQYVEGRFCLLPSSWLLMASVLFCGDGLGRFFQPVIFISSRRVSFLIRSCTCTHAQVHRPLHLCWNLRANQRLLITFDISSFCDSVTSHLFWTNPLLFTIYQFVTHLYLSRRALLYASVCGCKTSRAFAKKLGTKQRSQLLKGTRMLMYWC